MLGFRCYTTLTKADAETKDARGTLNLVFLFKTQGKKIRNLCEFSRVMFHSALVSVHSWKDNPAQQIHNWKKNFGLW